MAIEQREQHAARVGECRRCQSFCDKLIDPAGCIAIGCQFLYSYEDSLNGRTYLGCLNKVFNAEIDIEAVVSGIGGIKMTGPPLPQCHFEVERSYEGAGPEYECVNRRFFDCDHDGEQSVRAFDLRNALRE